MLGNINCAITGTYRALRKKHMVRYLAEFEWRFNYRFDLAAMIPPSAALPYRNPTGGSMMGLNQDFPLVNSATQWQIYAARLEREQELQFLYPRAL
jgi:hypothetical protein